MSHIRLTDVSAPAAFKGVAVVGLSFTDVIMLQFQGSSAVAGGGLALLVVYLVAEGLRAAAKAWPLPRKMRIGDLRASLDLATLCGGIASLFIVLVCLLAYLLPGLYEMKAPGVALGLGASLSLVPLAWSLVLDHLGVSFKATAVACAVIVVGNVVVDAVVMFVVDSPIIGAFFLGATTTLMWLLTALVLWALLRKDERLRPVLSLRSSASAGSRQLGRALIHSTRMSLHGLHLPLALVLITGYIGTVDPGALTAHVMVAWLVILLLQLPRGCAVGLARTVPEKLSDPASHTLDDRAAVAGLHRGVVLLTSVYVGVVAVAFLLAGPLVTRILFFGLDEPDQDTQRLAIVMLMIAATVLVGAAFAHLESGFYTGLRPHTSPLSPQVPVWVTAGCTWLIGVLGAGVLAFIFDNPALSVWVAAGLAAVVCAAIMGRLAHLHLAHLAPAPAR